MDDYEDPEPGGNSLPVGHEAYHLLDRPALVKSEQADGMPDTTPEATPVPEVRGPGVQHTGPRASGEVAKAKLLEFYRDRSLAKAAEESGIAQEDVEDWLADDEEFADAFERVNRLKALRIRQKFIDAFESIAETIIVQAKGSKKRKASMAAAKLALDLAGLGKKSARRVEPTVEDDGEAQQVARELGWLR